MDPFHVKKKKKKEAWLYFYREMDQKGTERMLMGRSKLLSTAMVCVSMSLEVRCWWGQSSSTSKGCTNEWRSPVNCPLSCHNTPGSSLRTNSLLGVPGRSHAPRKSVPNSVLISLHLTTLDKYFFFVLETRNLRELILHVHTESKWWSWNSS